MSVEFSKQESSLDCLFFGPAPFQVEKAEQDKQSAIIRAQGEVRPRVFAGCS